jgi:hypothetical protein
MNPRAASSGLFAVSEQLMRGETKDEYAEPR